MNEKPIINTILKPQHYRYITVHCSATTATMDIGAKTICHWHLARGWRDIGYHFVIRRSGLIELGRDLSQMGAHVAGHNRGNIGICLVGGCNDKLQPEDNFTFAQRKALFALITQLQKRFNIQDNKVKAHNQWNASKACPVININGDNALAGGSL